MTTRTLYHTWEAAPVNEINDLKLVCFPHLHLATEEERMYDTMSMHLVVRVSGRVAGYARLRHISNKRNHVYIDRVCVNPEFRGAGIFSGMMAFIERRYPKACLRLKARFHLAQAYKKMGYQPVARDEAFEYLQKV